jgi:TolA-binding protein
VTIDVQEIGALRGELAEVSAAKSAAEASLASLTASSTATTGEVERLKKSDAERKKELTRLNKQVEQLSAAEAERKKELARLNKQVEQLSAAKSELESRSASLEQRLRDREAALVRAACLHVRPLWRSLVIDGALGGLWLQTKEAAAQSKVSCVAMSSSVISCGLCCAIFITDDHGDDVW